MSLILNDQSIATRSMFNGPGDDFQDSALLDRYLAILETNKAAARFIPNDALMALDMAGFVRDRIAGERTQPQVSAARMALALVQPLAPTRIQ